MPIALVNTASCNEWTPDTIHQWQHRKRDLDEFKRRGNSNAYAIADFKGMYGVRGVDLRTPLPLTSKSLNKPGDELEGFPLEEESPEDEESCFMRLFNTTFKCYDTDVGSSSDRLEIDQLLRLFCLGFNPVQ